MDISPTEFRIKFTTTKILKGVETTSDNIVTLNQELIHTELKDLVRNSAEETLNAMLDAEADKLINAEQYALDEQRQGYRAGHYERNFTTISGDVTLKIPSVDLVDSVCCD